MSKTVELTPEEEVLFLNYYNLTEYDKSIIRSMKLNYGMTVDEISRKYRITPPDVNRVINPPENYGNWTAEDKKRHWLAGKKRAATVKKNRELAKLNKI